MSFLSHVSRSARIAPLVACLLIGASSARGWDSTEAEVEEAHSLATGIRTPHTPWARPLAGGPVRAYAFVGVKTEGMNTHAREIAELAQRVDLDLDVSWRYSFHRDHWFGGDAGERRIVRLMKKSHDVFIFQDVHPDTLGTGPLQDGRAPFMEQVKAGAGVVLINADVLPQPKPAKPAAKEQTPAPQLFADAQPLDPLPTAIEAAGGLKAFEYGSGRIVQMPARPKIPTGPGGRSNTTSGRSGSRGRSSGRRSGSRR